jgi:SAM-dependent methyltransferase
LNQRPYDLGGAKIDTIVCLNVLEHIEDDLAVLRGLHDLLPEGGRLILQVPNHPWLFGSLDESYGHFRRYDYEGLHEVLRNAGFDDVSIRCFNPFSIPGWFVSGRLLRAKRLDVTSLRAYDALVPLLRCVDVTSRLTGLALIAVAEKR